MRLFSSITICYVQDSGIHLNRNSIKNMLISLEKVQLESKLNFSFVSFPYKLNFLDFCSYFFFELMNIFFFILFLFNIVYVKILNVTNCN